MKGPVPISDSYIELCLHLEGKPNVYLRIPTFWDDTQKKWHGIIKTPKTLKLIHVEGKTSGDLQKDVDRKFEKILNASNDFSLEVAEMFQPLSYWNEM